MDMPGDIMTKGLIVTCILIVSINSARATECQTSAQGVDSHWAWRLIDGRKCWYKGASGMDKSLLHWPADDNSPDRLGASPDKPNEEKRPAPPQVQAIAPEILQMLPIMPPHPSFEDRWRLR